MEETITMEGSSPHVDDMSFGEGSCEAVGLAVADFMKSEVGQETVLRLSFSALSSDDTDFRDAASADDICLFETSPFRSLLRVLAQHLFYQNYSPFDGTWCAPLEGFSLLRTLSLSISGSTELLCHRYRWLRDHVYTLHNLFMIADRPATSFGSFRMRRHHEVNWSSVSRFFAHADMFTLRSPRLIEFVSKFQVRNVKSSSSVGVKFGDSIMLFLCNFAPGYGQDERDVLKAFTVLTERDYRYLDDVKQLRAEKWIDDSIVPLTQSRKATYGSPAYFYRTLSDSTLSVGSDYFADRSSIFRFLRHEFRLGPYYLEDEEDDYGQVNYCHRLGAT